MKLSYRGNSYEVEPISVDMAESGVAGQYRGQTFQFSYPRHIPVSQPVSNLKYRGVAYRTDSTGRIATIPAEIETAPAVVARTAVTPVAVPMTVSRRAALADVARVHRQNVERNLQHRLDVAKQRGDQALVRLLEQEMQQLA